MRHIDELLLGWAESQSIICSASAQQFIAQTGFRKSLECGTKRCRGEPVMHVDGWRCSGCRKEWPLEVAYIPKERRAKEPIRVSESVERIRLVDMGSVIHAVARDLPWPFEVWWAHVVGPRSGPPRQSFMGYLPTLGIAQDEIPAHLQGLVEAGDLPEPPCALTVYRVRKWIQLARRAARWHSTRRFPRRPYPSFPPSER